jgi:hypothetical protein
MALKFFGWEKLKRTGLPVAHHTEETHVIQRRDCTARLGFKFPQVHPVAQVGELLKNVRSEPYQVRAGMK